MNLGEVSPLFHVTEGQEWEQSKKYKSHRDCHKKASLPTKPAEKHEAHTVRTNRSSPRGRKARGDLWTSGRQLAALHYGAFKPLLYAP